MTVLDSSGAVDYLLGESAHDEVGAIFEERTPLPLAAPQTLVFEVLSALRRAVLRGAVSAHRADTAARELGLLQLELFPLEPLRARAWALRDNFTTGDAFFVALAESLGEPLATKDRPLAHAAEEIAGVRVTVLAG